MDRCVQFQLPNGAGGLGAQMVSSNIKKKLMHLKVQKKIGEYKIGHESYYKMNVWFKNESDYTAFCLVWDFETFRPTAKIVDCPKEKNPYNTIGKSDGE